MVRMHHHTWHSNSYLSMLLLHTDFPCFGHGLSSALRQTSSGAHTNQVGSPGSITRTYDLAHLQSQMDFAPAFKNT
jgi:hypothetical protein